MISVRQLLQCALLTLFFIAQDFAAGEDEETTEPTNPDVPTERQLTSSPIVPHPSSVAITDTRTLNTDRKSAFLQASSSAGYNVKNLTSSATKSVPLAAPVTVTNSVVQSRKTGSVGISSTQKELLSDDKTSTVTSVKWSVSPAISATTPVATSTYMSASVVPTTPSKAAPTAAPQNVTAYNLTSQSLFVAWQPPPNGTLNGELSRYEVSIRKKTAPTQAPASSLVSSTHSVDSKASVAPSTEPPTESPNEEGGKRSLSNPDERLIKVGLNLSTTVLSLDKWTEYYVQVRAVTKNGVQPGPYSDVRTVRTDEDVPGAPEGLHAATVNSSAVSVNWIEPLVKNGILRKYQVSYSINGSGAARDISVGLRTSYVLSGLKGDSTYNIKVVAFTSKGKGNESETTIMTAEGVPSAPQNVSAKSINSTAVRVRWLPPQNPNGEVTYKVSYKPASDDRKFRVKGTELVVSGLQEFVLYNFTVVAVNAKNEDWASPPAFATETTDSAEPSGPPQDVSALTQSSSSILVMWTPPLESEQNGVIVEYRVKYYSSSAGEGKVRNTTGDNTTLKIDGLKSSQLYTFTVQAVNKDGEGPESEPVSNTTFEDIPSAPQNVSAKSINSTAVRVRWLPPQNPNGEVTYKVSYKPASDDRKFRVKGTELVVSGLQEFVLYNFTVVAVNAKHEDWASPPAFATETTDSAEPSGPPQDVSALTQSSSSILVMWTPPLESEQNGVIVEYRVKYYSSSAGEEKVRNTTGDNTTLKIDGLKSFQLYNFTVQAVNKDGEGPKSEPVSNRTFEDKPSGPPQDVSALTQSSSSILVMWTPPLESEQNGVIVEYRVKYYSSSAGEEKVRNTATGDERTLVIDGLKSSQLYNFTVQAVNKVGEGPKSEPVSNTTFKDVLPTIGTLAPPTSPDGNTFEIKLQKVPDTNGKISFYQVVVRELPTDSKDHAVPVGKDPNDYKPEDLLTYEQARAKKPTLTPYVAAQFPASKFDSFRTFTVGNGDKTPASARRRRRGVDNGTEYYNGPLEPSTYYTVFQRAYVSKDLYTSSEWMEPVQTAEVVTTPPPAEIDVGLVTGLSVFIVILLIVMFVSFWFLRKKRSQFGGTPIDDNCAFNDGGQPLKKLSRKRRSQQKRLMGSTDSLEALNDLAAQRARRVPIPVNEFEQHVERMHMDGDHGFSEEYGLVEPDEEYQYQAFLNPANKFKNRYANIVAYDHSRVVLSQIEGVPGSDYINANYIDGYQQSGAFIAAQGPLYETFDDFWRMVWEKHSHVIVMLTRLEERGRRKCDQYWPDSEMQVYGKVEVTVSEVLHMSHFTLRTFLVTHKQHPEEERMVRQFHYTTWPDHDVPTHPTPLLSLLRRASCANSDTTDPMIVHCSAGVGRTGTFITLDVMLKRIAHEEPIDVFGFVRQMRTQRNIMVQTEAQYVFIHDALLEAIACGVTEVEAKDLRARIRELRIEDEELGCTNMEKEFSRLAKEESHPMAFKNATMSCNSSKNRYCNILPFDSSRIRLRMRPGDLGSDYINASAVDGYCQPKAYIATQAPLPITYEDFWRLIWEQHSASIVMLTKEEEGGKVKCHHYWPSDGSRLYGEILVELIEESTYTDYITRKFKLTQTELKDTRTIRHFQYVDWPDNEMPDSGVGLVDLIGQVQKWQQQSGNNPIVVHCSGGVGRTGVFCAMSVMIERLKAEGLIDVFQTVQAMRLQRPAMVQTKEQYEFCYTTLQEYLDSFDLYANFQ